MSTPNWLDWMKQESYHQIRIVTFAMRHHAPGATTTREIYCGVSFDAGRGHHQASAYGMTENDAFALALSKVEAEIARREGREDQAADIPLVSCGGKNA